MSLDSPSDDETDGESSRIEYYFGCGAKTQSIRSPDRCRYNNDWKINTIADILSKQNPDESISGPVSKFIHKLDEDSNKCKYIARGLSKKEKEDLIREIVSTPYKGSQDPFAGLRCGDKRNMKKSFINYIISHRNDNENKGIPAAKPLQETPRTSDNSKMKNYSEVANAEISNKKYTYMGPGLSEREKIDLLTEIFSKSHESPQGVRAEEPAQGQSRTSSDNRFALNAQSKVANAEISRKKYEYMGPGLSKKEKIDLLTEILCKSHENPRGVAEPAQGQSGPSNDSMFAKDKQVTNEKTYNESYTSIESSELFFVDMFDGLESDFKKKWTNKILTQILSESNETAVKHIHETPGNSNHPAPPTNCQGDQVDPGTFLDIALHVSMDTDNKEKETERNEEDDNSEQSTGVVSEGSQNQSELDDEEIIGQTITKHQLSTSNASIVEEDESVIEIPYISQNPANDKANSKSQKKKKLTPSRKWKRQELMAILESRKPISPITIQPDPPMPKIRKKRVYKHTSRSKEKFRALRIMSMASYLTKHISIVPFVWYKARFVCYFCKYTFSSMEELRPHMEFEHSDLDNLKPVHLAYSEVKLDISDLHCRHCFEEFFDFDSACNHINDVHGENFNMKYRQYFMAFKINLHQANCQLCDKVFTNFGNLYRHVKKNHTIGTQLCRFCGMSFLFLNQLESHLRSCSYNDDKKMYRCSLCPLSFPCLTNKRKHESSEHGIDFYKCRVCNEAFQCYSTLRKHELNEHDIGNRVYCTECPAKFKIAANLREHISVYHSERVPCHICGLKIASVHMKDHIKGVHTNPQSIPCDICEQTFTTPSTMRRHRKKHDK